MKTKLQVLTIGLIVFFLAACQSQKNTQDYSQFTKDFISFVDENPEMKALLVKSLDKCKQINPDTITNPVQSLEQYYDFVEWSTHCMPWNIFTQAEERDLFTKIDQSLNYFYWLVDQDLEELKDSDYYHPSLQYHEPFRTWLIDYTKQWGSYLSSEESWNEDYLKLVQENPKFGLQEGWYEDPSNWHSYNDFFSRSLKDEFQRPIAEPDNDALVVSPVDGEPQGKWEIDAEGLLVQKEGVQIKSRRYRSTEELLANSQYRDQFKNGTMVHTFLNVHDYHCYHFPVGGKVLEMLLVPGDEAIGGDVVFDPETKMYIIDCSVPQWQAIETRLVAIVQTEQFGLVALMPIGMSQVCSCNWAENLAVGQEVKKGDMLGYFLFGGSDFVILFQEGINVTIEPSLQEGDTYKHTLQGEAFCRLSK